MAAITAKTLKVQPSIEATSAGPGATLMLLELYPGTAAQEAEIHLLKEAIQRVAPIVTSATDGKVRVEEALTSIGAQAPDDTKVQRVVQILLGAIADGKLDWDDIHALPQLVAIFLA